MKYFESVVDSGLFNNLKKSDYTNAFAQLTVTGKQYGDGEAVFLEGDVIDKICIVARGSVRAEKTYRNGETHIIQVFDEGDLFGLEFSMSKTKKSANDYISNGYSSIVFVSNNSIKRSDYAPEIETSLTYRLADDNIKMAKKIEILVERGLRERILTYLNILTSKSGSNTVSVRMNREQLAQFLCVNRSALSNELNKMKKEGIIDFKKDKFTIL